MRWRSFWSLLLTFPFVGCVLSPGHDLPSAGSESTGDEGPIPPLPGDDGDIDLGGDGDASPIFPPNMDDASCTAGGGIGGMGGACGETGAHR